MTGTNYVQSKRNEIMETKISNMISRLKMTKDGERIDCLLFGGVGYPTSNALYGAPTASDYDFRATLCLGLEVMSPLPEILLPQEAERLHLLNELFLREHDQSLDAASCLSPPKQLYQPEHLEGPMQNCGPPSNADTSRSLLPLGEMIHGHSATHPKSYPFGHWHQQSSQQTLTDLNGNMQKQPARHSIPPRATSGGQWSIQPGMIDPSPPNSKVITDIFPNIVEAAPTVFLENQKCAEMVKEELLNVQLNA